MKYTTERKVNIGVTFSAFVQWWCESNSTGNEPSTIPHPRTWPQPWPSALLQLEGYDGALSQGSSQMRGLLAYSPGLGPKPLPPPGRYRSDRSALWVNNSNRKKERWRQVWDTTYTGHLKPSKMLWGVLKDTWVLGVLCTLWGLGGGGCVVPLLITILKIAFFL